MKTAKIGRFGGRVCEYALDDDADVNDLLTAASESLVKGETLSIDGETVTSGYDFDDADIVIIMPSTTGA